MCHQNFCSCSKDVPPKKGIWVNFYNKKPPGRGGEGEQMAKTNVLKLGVATFKNSLSTVKNFYILGESAVVGCIFKTKLLALEAKKNLPESGRVFCHKTGLCLDNILKKIISCPAGDVKIAQTYSVVSYSLFREFQAMGYRYCSRLVSQSHKTNSSNPDLGAISCCLQMCAGYFLSAQAGASLFWL